MASALHSLVWHAAGAAMLVAAVTTDIRSQRIPNAVVAAGMGCALVLAALPGGVGLPNAFLGLAAGFAAMLPLHLLRVMGAGDVKLMAAVGAFIGFPGALGAVLATLVAGGVMAIAWSARHRTTRSVVSNLRTGLFAVALDMAAGRVPPAGAIPVSPARIPYAIAIAAGALAQVLVAGRVGVHIT